MHPTRRRVFLLLAPVLASDRGYTARDTPSMARATGTIYRGGTRVIARRDTIFVRDTVIRRAGAGRVDTVRVQVVRVAMTLIPQDARAV